ncbi:MAG: MFS transporter [Deltaproteobacteria bacterium]|nr:MFS transporter [Deltaproteobacteria bacterium]
MPREIVIEKMIPGTALGVMFGDLVYSYMAYRLAKRTGRDDITAMPLGLDTPSTIGMAIMVIGPLYLETKDAMLSYKVAMAVMVFMGIVKIIFSFLGDFIKRVLPSAALLGPIAGIGLALLGFFPMTKIFANPVVGLVSMAIILFAFVGRYNGPFQIPAALLAVLLSSLIYYIGGLTNLFQIKEISPSFEFSIPTPSLGFIEGIPLMLKYISVAIPFGLLTIVGGINVTESARLAGDDYRTRDILLTEAIATLIAGVFGGVAQSTPYIGHPAYKSMGASAGYTILTALTIGIGSVLGITGLLVDLIPEAAVTPILLFIGIEIIKQAFTETPRQHIEATIFSFLPIIGYLGLLNYNSIIGSLANTNIPDNIKTEHNILKIIGNGFILTSLLWGALMTYIIERKLKDFVVTLIFIMLFTLCGLIHSPLSDGSMFLPWDSVSTGNTHWTITLGYLLFLIIGVFLIKYNKQTEFLEETGKQTK